MPEDDPEFQGLLEEEAPFLDISVEIPGVPLEEEEEEYQVVTDKAEPGFEELAGSGSSRAPRWAMRGQRDCVRHHV